MKNKIKMQRILTSIFLHDNNSSTKSIFPFSTAKYNGVLLAKNRKNFMKNKICNFIKNKEF